MSTRWGLIEVPQIEVAPASRRIEVFGTRRRRSDPAPRQRPPREPRDAVDRGLRRGAARAGRASSCPLRRCMWPTCTSSRPWWNESGSRSTASSTT
jgi:hypothetical protein